MGGSGVRIRRIGEDSPKSPANQRSTATISEKARDGRPCLIRHLPFLTLTPPVASYEALNSIEQLFIGMTRPPNLQTIRAGLSSLADPVQAQNLQRFFKTGPGEYGEGDRFLGLRVPQIRSLVKQLGSAPLTTIRSLLKSPIHEERMLALLLMVKRYQNADEAGRERLYRLYLDSTAYINNWDLVDVTANHIVGAWLYPRSRRPLHTLAKSDSLWERRIAVIATFYFISQGEFDESLKIAERLLRDPHDLIHKAVGWMLREIGKRDREKEEAFLKQHYRSMPRTMLRYAIERFPERRRQAYLKGRVL